MPQSARTAIDASLSERDFQAMVIEAARYFGYTAYHTHDSRRSQAGWPDVVLMHATKHRLHIWEIKKTGGRVSPMQWMWIHGLQSCGIDADVKYPKDWDAIMETLSA